MSACSADKKDKDARVAVVPKRTQLLANPAVAGLVPMNDFATDEREAAGAIRRLVGGSNTGSNGIHDSNGIPVASEPMQWPNV